MNSIKVKVEDLGYTRLGKVEKDKDGFTIFINGNMPKKIQRAVLKGKLENIQLGEPDRRDSFIRVLHSVFVSEMN